MTCRPTTLHFTSLCDAVISSSATPAGGRRHQYLSSTEPAKHIQTSFTLSLTLVVRATVKCEIQLYFNSTIYVSIHFVISYIYTYMNSIYTHINHIAFINYNKWFFSFLAVSVSCLDCSVLLGRINCFHRIAVFLNQNGFLIVQLGFLMGGAWLELRDRFRISHF